MKRAENLPHFSTWNNTWENASGVICRRLKPAIIQIDSGDVTLVWCEDDERHRVGGPAYLNTCGDFSWWSRGCLHRVDGPALHTNGKSEYFINGETKQ